MAQDEWFDEEAGPLVRPYVRTGGRTQPQGADLDVVTQVVAAPRLGDSALSANEVAVLELCRTPVSVAEVAAQLQVPLLMARVLVADLLRQGYLTSGTQPPGRDSENRELLKKVLDGVRNL